MQIINDIPVWGEADEATLAQIKRCAADPEVAGAALMADNHKGYSMPIGGVIAYRNAVSPSGVGYDISCLAAGTLVSTEHGYARPIEDVTRDPALCWDGERVRPITPLFGSIARGMRSTLEIKLTNGRTITATPDHQILTKAGWRQAGDLTLQDKIACNPFVGLPFEAPAGIIPLEIDQRYAEELTQHDLYPLHSESPLFPLVLSLLAYASGDGHLAGSGKYIAFYTTNEVDAVDIVAHLSALGYRGLVYRRTRSEQHKAEICIRVNSKALHALFAALGSPVGKKEWPATPMPWLFELVSWQRARFLSAFCSAEMMTPRLNRLLVPNLQLKQAGENDNAIQFVGRLFASLGYHTSIAESGAPRNERQDFVLQVLGGEAETLRFMSEVGFCYAHAKRLAAAQVASMIWQRNIIVAHRTAARQEARLLRASGQRNRDIVPALANKYQLSPHFIAHSLDSNRGQPRIPSTTIIDIDVSGEMCWVEVQEIREGEACPVYDLVTDDPAQAFFAQGVVVHNCGVKGVRTNLHADDIRWDMPKIMDQVARTVVFGIGRTSGKNIDHELFDDPAWKDQRSLNALKQQARQQLGTVGSGNHYVNILEDEQGFVWITAHFGSRGLGHRIASGFLNLAAGRAFDDKAPGEHMDQPATVISLSTDLGQSYWQAMELAGRYAYAGRDFVVNQVLEILGTQAVDSIHNHHNYAWRERHNGEDLIVVRKGATPAWPGERGVVGGSMGDITAIVQGIESPAAQASLRSTVHGAGRLMSRTQAAGKQRWVKENGQRVLKVIKEGQISVEMMQERVKSFGVELRGAGTDESPQVYRALQGVLDAHADSIVVQHRLRPLGVAMAGADIFDPYKD